MQSHCMMALRRTCTYIIAIINVSVFASIIKRLSMPSRGACGGWGQHHMVRWCTPLQLMHKTGSLHAQHLCRG